MLNWHRLLTMIPLLCLPLCRVDLMREGSYPI